VAYNLGVQAALRAGVQPGSIVKTQAEYNADIEAAERRGEELAKSGGRAQPPGAGNATAAGTSIRSQAEADIQHIAGKISHGERERIRRDPSIPQV
jgi:hypothetical protein